MGSSELIANLFRISQTEEKLKKDNVNTEKEACKTHNKIGKIVSILKVLFVVLSTESSGAILMKKFGLLRCVMRTIMKHLTNQIAIAMELEKYPVH